MSEIRRLFVANRGECAFRIMRSARRLGIHIIAAADDYGDAHCVLADEVKILPAGYLDIAGCVSAAKSAHACAVHPGWGFLSESADFAEAVARAGMIFIGPSPAAMRRAASKADARQLAQKVGVPVAPGFDKTNADVKTLTSAARKIGWPVLIKAAAGGGGRGMRIAKSESDFAAAITEAKREAKSGFGDSAIILEKYVPRARHVEAQLLCAGGEVIVAGLRDCSMQRRRQKVLEESPPPRLSAKTARELSDAAAALAKEMNYENAGTAEFLLSGKEWFFLEMNARLQVEHALTELTCGVDLVEWQIRAAEGAPTPPVSQSSGYAMEARVCAEEPMNDFLPATGTATCRFPKMPNVRVDAGGDVVSIGGEYDSMLAKVIAHGDTREQTRRQLINALAECEVAGVSNNVAFLRHLADDDDFAAGRVRITLLEERRQTWMAALNKQRQQTASLAAAYLLLSAPAGGFRMNDSPQTRCVLRDKKESFEFVARMQNDECHVSLEKDTIVLHAPATTADGICAVIDGVSVFARCRHENGRITVFYNGLSLSLDIEPPSSPNTGGAPAQNAARAPMSATVREICVKTGSQVAAGDALVVLEAMKMEVNVVAPRAGVLSEIFCAVGDAVAQGALLVRIDDGKKTPPRRVVKKRPARKS